MPTRDGTDMGAREPYSSYSESRDDPRFSEWLRSRAREPWDAMLNHRFVSDCTDGRIETTVYRTYLEQEFAFVETAAVALGYAVVNAPSFEEIRRFADALSGLVTDQRRYFERAFAELDVDGWREPEPFPETRRLSDVVYRGATTPGYAESLAPMLAAEWLYATWCHRAVAAGSFDPDSLVGEWIRLHDDPEFRSHATWLRDEMDRVGPALSATRQREVATLFGRTLESEVRFHDAPYDRSGVTDS